MRKLKTFSYVLVHSLTSPAYYADILKVPFSFSFKFFLFFFFLYSLISAGILTTKLYPILQKITALIPTTISESYPPDLEIKITNGSVTVNQPEPYLYPMDRFNKILNKFQENILGANTSDLDNLLVIDTQATSADFELYHTYALLTQKQLIYINDNGNTEIVSLSQITNFTLNQAEVNKVVAALKPYLNYLTPITLVIVLIAMLYSIPISHLFYLCFFALIAWIISRVVRLPLRYKQSFQMSLHLIILPTLLLGVLSLLGIKPEIPLFRTLLLTLLMTGILLKLKEISALPPPDVS